MKKGVPSRPTKTPSKQPAAPAVIKAPAKSVLVANPKKVAKPQTLPSQKATRALKAPKIKGKGRAEQIQSRLKKKSPWFASISDPLHGADAKIPDETGVQTGVCQLVQRGRFKSNAHGYGGVRMPTVYINSHSNAPSAGPSNDQGLNFQYISSDSGDGGLKWNDGTAWGTDGTTCGQGFAFDGAGELKAITNAHRVVSACVIVQPEASLATNQGEMTMYAIPFGYIDQGLVYDRYVNAYKSVQIPLNTNSAGTALWYPFEREDESFKSFFDTEGEAFSTVIDNVLQTPYWEIGCVASGISEDGEGVDFRYQLVVNYEFKPLFNTLNVVNAAPSPSDAMEMDLVENWVQDLPVAKPMPPSKAAASPSAVSPKHEDDETGFGMFFNVFEELLPLAAPLAGLLI